MQRIMDTTKMDNLGWIPTTNLKDGIKITLRWFKENLNNIRT